MGLAPVRVDVECEARLRWALGIAIAHAGPIRFRDDDPYARQVAMWCRTVPQEVASLVLPASRAAHMGEGRQAVDAVRQKGESGGGGGSQMLSSALTHVGDGEVTSKVCILKSQLVEDGDTDVHATFDGERVTAAMTIPRAWLSRVVARGICRDQLVLDVTEQSPDGERLLVRAARWERDADGGERAHNRPAELTWLDETGWTTRWSHT